MKKIAHVGYYIGNYSSKTILYEDASYKAVVVKENKTIEIETGNNIQKAHHWVKEAVNSHTSVEDISDFYRRMDAILLKINTTQPKVESPVRRAIPIIAVGETWLIDDSTVAKVKSIDFINKCVVFKTKGKGYKRIPFSKFNTCSRIRRTRLQSFLRFLLRNQD